MVTGYCTLDDVRRALRSANLPGDVQQEPDIAIDAIMGQTEFIQKTYDRHWYEPGGLNEDSVGLIPTSTKTRDDEYDIPSQGATVIGSGQRSGGTTPATGTVFDSDREQPELKQQIRLSSGRLDDATVPTYTRLTLARKDVQAITSLSVINADGGYDDWVTDSAYSGGVGTTHRGEDYWVRVDSGVSKLYFDVHSMDDDLPALSNAVYAGIEYGHEGIPRTVRRGVAFRAAADLVEEAVVDIPQNATIYNVETKAEELRSQAEQLLGEY